ncbi:MAG: Translation elongation factor LepA, partial [uncultured Quadrisphaera sp.]
ASHRPRPRRDRTRRGRPRGDRPGPPAQLLHHRPHRPRQVHARRPDAPDHRGGRRPGHAGAVPGPDGHRARARHHHQVAGGADAVGGRRHRPRPEHDRHPGARRLHLRGLPLPGRVRGRGAAGRRRAGHRGADPGEPVPGDGERAGDRAGAEQDRPAGGAAGAVRRGAGLAGGRGAGRRAAGLGQDRRRRPRAARPHRRGRARAGRRPRRPDPGDDLRLRLRHLPRRGHLRPRRRRAAEAAREDRHDVDPRHPRAPGDRGELPGAGAQRGPRRGRGGLPDHRREGRAPEPGRRHRHQRGPPVDGHRGAVRGPQAHGLLGAVPHRRLRLPAPARRPRPAQAQRRRAELRAGDLRGPRLRLPLRVPRPAPPGDHPRPPRAGVRARPHRHGPVGGLRGDPGRRARGHRDQPQRVPRGQGRRGARAGGEGDGAHAVGVHRHRDGAVPAAARRAPRHGLPLARAGGDALHAADGGDRLRLLRPPEVAHPRLRQLRLRPGRRPGRRPGEGRHPAPGRAGRRVQRDRAPRQGLRLRADDGRQAEGPHPAPAVRGAGAGRDRRPGDRPRDRARDPQGRARQVLRRRHHAQAQAAGEAEGGQEADEDGRPGRGAPGGLHRRAEQRPGQRQGGQGAL